MDYNNALTLLQRHDQTQLLKYYQNLSNSEKEVLLKQIEKLDFSCLNGIENLDDKKAEVGEYSPVNALSLNDLAAQNQTYFNAGKNALLKGEVAAVLLAGGQGSRLGYDGPKGTYNIGINTNLSIFGAQFKNMTDVVNAVGCYFTVFVMTSEKNDAKTKEFFKLNNYFGFPEDRIHFFIQQTSPACDFNGKILLEDAGKIALAPNGNGGWYSSLINSDCGKIINKENIKWLNVYSVDNVLQRICDPVFIGATLAGNYDCGAKVVKKSCPEERVGLLVLENNKPTIVEYYELDEKTANMRDSNGELTYRYGVILNYLFAVDTLNKVVGKSLPYHYAKKIIPYYEDGKIIHPQAPNAYKTETLVVDMIKLMGNCLAVEVDREKEFAPVKNKTGVDSVESARLLLIKNGVSI
ncbi:MAG: UTP--glucose-1-phosphate uridylyltransferase [Clostridia bacterium]|nr:UTP--glucose-1-phosphate uridylyltransferase [Clostridia bacterium]